jgi:hypothetical protein
MSQQVGGLRVGLSVADDLIQIFLLWLARAHLKSTIDLTINNQSLAKVIGCG